MNWLRNIVYRCDDCKRLRWFEFESRSRICYPCFYLFDLKLRREEDAKMIAFVRELEEENNNPPD